MADIELRQAVCVGGGPWDGFECTSGGGIALDFTAGAYNEMIHSYELLEVRGDQLIYTYAGWRRIK